MGNAKVKITVKLSDGTPCPGAGIYAYNETALIEEIKEWNGTADKNGIYIFNQLDRGFKDKYEITATYKDKDGILYKGWYTDKISEDINVTITVNPFFPMGDKYNEVIEKVKKIGNGNGYIISVMQELISTMQYNLNRASLALETHFLEWLIKKMATSKGIWQQSYDKLTFGQLINEEAIKKILPPGAYDKLKALSYLRNTAVHSKEINTLPEEVQIAWQMIEVLVDRL